jgi:hypothetical protein
MADRPSFQFYPGDWRKNANLGRCSMAARGAWMDVLCVLHDSDEYGVMRCPLKELANSARVSLKLLRELVDKGVLKGAEKGERCAACTYETTRREGKSRVAIVVTLLEEGDGPLWYSSRMVKDEYLRNVRAAGGEAGKEYGAMGAEYGSKGGRPAIVTGDKNPPLQDSIRGDKKPPIKPPPSSSSSSSSSPSGKDQNLPAAVIAQTWWPSPRALEDLRMLHGYTPDWIDQQVSSFVAYWLDRGEARTSWDALFIDHCMHRAKIRSVS